MFYNKQKKNKQKKTGKTKKNNKKQRIMDYYIYCDNIFIFNIKFYA